MSELTREQPCKVCGGVVSTETYKRWHFGRCYPCALAFNRASNKKHPHKNRREYWKKLRAEKNPVMLARNRRNTNNMRKRKPEQEQARRIVRAAINRGDMIKPSICSACNAFSSRIEGHHHLGYDYPLDVQWLCVSCHRAVHKEMAHAKH